MTILTQKEVNGCSDGAPLALEQERLQNTSATTEHILAAGGKKEGTVEIPSPHLKTTKIKKHDFISLSYFNGFG